jgi:predicted nuclease with TOPRIM domain
VFEILIGAIIVVAGTVVAEKKVEKFIKKHNDMVDKHNEVAKKYNSLFEDSKELEKDYNRVVDKHNNLVDASKSMKKNVDFLLRDYEILHDILVSIYGEATTNELYLERKKAKENKDFNALLKSIVISKEEK